MAAVPDGAGAGSASASAKVTAQRGPLGARLVAELALGDLRITQETLLWDGTGRVDFRTHVDGSIGTDRLLRVRFPAAVPGGLPVYATATAVIGRPFGHPDADVAEHPFTLDNPAHEWFGLGSVARAGWAGPGGERQERAFGVAEIVLPGPASGGSPPSLPNGPRDAITRLVAALAGAGVTATCGWPDGPRYGALDLDSNLPDVRIALGGPEDNPWTARLLAECGPDVAAEVRGLLGTGRPAAVWLPAGQSRAAAFGPGADVRGYRDLPVLLMAGPDLAAAAEAVTAGLAGPVLEVTPVTAAGPDPDPPLAGHAVALLNRGTPSSLVSPDAVLHITLMRSCTAWPAGVWIDGDRRTAPDGSSFAWQHWSHTFEYALAAGPGDWRTAGFAQAGQEFARELLTCETGLHDGPRPAAASLGSVGGPAMLTALKPHGNPLAAGRDGTPDRAAGVIARLRDLGGAPGSRAEVRLGDGITAARHTGPGEEERRRAPATAQPAGSGARAVGGGPVEVTGGVAHTTVPAAGTVTLAVAVRPAAGGPGPGTAGDLGPGARPGRGPGASPGPGPGPRTGPPEPAQPVFTRYWLHGKGPAPAGGLPVAVHLSPGRLHLPAGAPAPVAARLTVAAGPGGASGAIELDVPDGLVTEPSGRLHYDLPSLGHAAWELAVRGRPGAPPGHYFLAARIRDQLGQACEDVTMVALGGPPGPDPGLPLEGLLPAFEADQQAIDAELGVAVLTPSLDVAPGGSAELAVRVTSQAASPVRGEAQLISPFGSWTAIQPWTQGFAVSPGKEVTLRYHVRVPVTTRHGTQWWTMVKLMYFGRLRYTSAVPVVVRA